MKFFKYIGICSLICFAFFYTEKIIDVSIMHDDVMIDIQDDKNNFFVEPKNAVIDGEYITPGNKGIQVDIYKSYTEMKRLGYYDRSLLVFEDIYPDTSIYNNYNKYIIRGNIYNKKVSLVFIINNKKVFNNFISILNKKNIVGNFFVDGSFLNNNMDIIDNNLKHEFYNYGNNGLYSKDNIIIINNIINNKSNNKSMFCLFLEANLDSLYNCAQNKMLSIMPFSVQGYVNIKNNVENGSIILINNSFDLINIIDFITSKGYEIKPLSETIVE